MNKLGGFTANNDSSVPYQNHAFSSSNFQVWSQSPIPKSLILKLIIFLSIYSLNANYVPTFALNVLYLLTDLASQKRYEIITVVVPTCTWENWGIKSLIWLWASKWEFTSNWEYEPKQSDIFLIQYYIASVLCGVFIYLIWSNLVTSTRLRMGI